MFKHIENNVKETIDKGLYNPRNEHDACGIGFVANIKNKKSHQIMKDGLSILENLTIEVPSELIQKQVMVVDY